MAEKLDKVKVKKVFDTFDYNGNGILSLAEIDRAVIELYPHLAEDKPAIMRAYKAADTSRDGFIDFKEFGRLIDLLFYYDEIYKLFSKLDRNHDRRVSFEEFQKGHELIGIHTRSKAELKGEFDAIDTNHGGYILFEEFCIYAAKQKLIASPDDYDNPTRLTNCNVFLIRTVVAVWDSSTIITSSPTTKHLPSTKRISIDGAKSIQSCPFILEWIE
ncbi:13142_t:CDS:2 [Ambispora leptoticha]|uniref:13142_t:CDS:1 n=1 Tax=Ambispora leptoticha TaxID=144679 RepID=A0A9N8W4X8_9GLOM|nr:13142_t:CDS:2 [Ambispora leptoticha]